MDGAATLSAGIASFCAELRAQHQFAIGIAEERDALRALDAVGISDRRRVRSALRLVCCSTPAQTQVFDRAFDDFFDTARPGLPQAAHAPRHTRPGRETPPTSADAPRPGATPRAGETAAGPEPATLQAGRSATDRGSDEATGWELLRARYSPQAGRGTALALDATLLAQLRPVAARLVRTVACGRSRRWGAVTRGGRFDLRRTIRASLETGGDPIVVRYLGHPRRNPRFVILIDGSRSMADHTAAVIAFAAALCERTVRADVLLFSTALHDVTRDLRHAARAGTAIGNLGEAWGGGTQIGVNFARFVDAYAARLLSPDTLVIVYSDGLDAGDVGPLERAMREIDRRCAAIVWLNPHAALPDYRPSARGMQAALPHITLLGAANDVRGFAALVDRIAQLPRIRGRRR